MDIVFRNALEEAEKGKSIIEKYYNLHVNNEGRQAVVLIFPDDDKRVLTSASKYLDRFLEEYHYDCAVILSSVDISNHDLQAQTSKPLYIYSLNQSDMIAVLRFYSFTQESTSVKLANVKLMSFRMPFNQKLDDLIGFKDITADKLVFYCLFGMLSKGA